MYKYDWSILWSAEWGTRILDGFLITLSLIGICLPLAVMLGFIIGTARWAGGKLVAGLCATYIEFIRNTPALVQLLFWYFSASFILPISVLLWMRNLGFEYIAAVIALTVYHGAFIAEVVRAGLNSVPTGQVEAARVLGLNFAQRLRYVVLPQAIRVAIPPLTNETVSLTKNTSLALAVGVAELTYQVRYIDAYTFRIVETLFAATVLYMGLCLFMSGLGFLVNLRLSKHLRVKRELGFGLD